MNYILMRYKTVLFAILLLLLLPRPAGAHASLLESDPAANSVIAQAPSTARLRFSEPVEPASSRVVLLDAGGATISDAPSRVAEDDAHVMLLDMPPLGDGRYALQWRALSSLDGHTTEGTIPFAVGDPAAADAPLMLPPPPADPLALASSTEVLLRWMVFMGLSGTIGSLLFEVYVWRPAGPSNVAVARSWAGPARRFEQGATLLALLAAAGLLLLAASNAGAGVFAFVSGGRVGRLLALRACLALLLAVVAIWGTGRIRPVLGLGLGAGALLTVSLLSHNAVPHGSPAAVTAAVTALSIGFDWVHLIATTAWIGGLLPLLLALRALRRAEPATSAGSASRLVARFTALATSSVIVLVATGSYSAFHHIGQPRELLTTTYGRSLSLKLLLFGVLLLLGGYNRWRIHPRLAPASAVDAAAPLVRRLRRSIAIELAAGAIVLLTVGMLTAVPPARAAAQAASGRTQTVRVGGVRLALQVVPAGVMGDTFALDVRGLPAGARPEVLLRTSMEEHGMAEQELDLQEVEPGRWGARAAQLTMQGAWRVEAIVRARGMEDIRHTFVVDTAVPAQADAAPGAPTLWPLLLVVAVVLFALSQLPSGLRVRRGLQGAGLLLLAGMVIAAAVPSTQPASTATAEAALGSVPETAANGRVIYEQSCVSCHGPTGRGDGVAGWALDPPPADFTAPHFTAHTEAELFDSVKNGIPGTSMPPFGSSLSDEQIRDVLAYIRQLASGAAD